MCKITSSWEPAGIDRELSSVLRNDLEEWGGAEREAQGDIYRHSADSHHCTGETLAPWKKSYDTPSQHIKKQRHHFANKGPSS